MRKTLLLFVLFIISKTLFCQVNENKDTLVLPDEITYHSELEKEAFNDFFNNGKENYLELFFAKDKDLVKDEYLSRKESFLSYIESLKSDNTNTKSGKKKVKYFFKKIHDKYLVKYELNAYFPQIFKTGYYNCVTGTILFSLIFDKLNIPYVIKVSPIHAYLVAYPLSESIIVETTNPLKGYFVFNQNFKDDYVKYLKESKLISAQEYGSATINELFEKYYFKEKNITLKDMVGIQYYNEAVEDLQNQKYEEAYYNLEKAYLFYPSNDIGYLLYYTAAMVINNNDFSDLKYVDFLYKILRFKNYGIKSDQIVSEFARITQNQLDYKGNYSIYDSIYNRLYSKLSDIKTRDEIAFIYNYEKARLYIRNNRTDEALSHIGAAYSLRPEHLDVQTMLMYCISNKFRTKSITEKTLNEFLDFANLYPAIKVNDIYSEMLCNIYVQLAVRGYEENNLLKAQEYQKLFYETIINKEPTDYENNISIVYSSASVYYFRRGNMAKSKALILEGLKLAPNSYELKQRLKAFN